jgi:DNA-binding NarL/FixJ family response regulator
MPAKQEKRSAPEPRPSTPKRRLLLVDDHPVTREGFAQLLNQQPDLEVCGLAGTAARAMGAIETLDPDLVVMEVALPDANGLELIKRVRTRYRQLKVLVLAGQDEVLYAERALRAGARGYIMKQAETAEVFRALRTVLRGESYLSEKMRGRLVHEHLHGAHALPRKELDTLSDRELEVFELLGHGHTTRRIAGKLHVSVSTVETHRAHIKQKLKLEHAVELVRRAVEWVGRQGR